MKAFLLIVYGVAMWVVGALSYRWMIDKCFPDLGVKLSKRILSWKEDSNATD